MSRVRPPAVADLFYPGSATELRRVIGGFLSPAPPSAEPAPVPKALIVPHAGYVYSGPVAGMAYGRLWPIRDLVRRVVLVGPVHRVSVEGLALPAAAAFATPLGQVDLDRAGTELAATLASVCTSDAAHAEEHSLEVQLPFLQMTLADFALVPLVVGDASVEDVAAVLEALWGGPETLVVVSSDLSHYHDYPTAARLDEQTSQAIESLRPDDLHHGSACGRRAIQGLLLMAQRRGLQVQCVDRRSSGDTAGSRDRVVGYGSYIVH